MDPRQVVALAVILDSEFPIAVHLKLEPAVKAAVVQRLVELGPAGEQLGVCFLKGQGGARYIDPDDIHPDVAAHLYEAQ